MGRAAGAEDYAAGEARFSPRAAAAPAYGNGGAVPGECDRLAQALEHPDTRTEAADAIRGLIDAIVLTPAVGALEAHVIRRGRRAQTEAGGQESGLQIELRGNLAAMLSAAKNATRSPEIDDLELQIAMVAGAGFEPSFSTFALDPLYDLIFTPGDRIRGDPAMAGEAATLFQPPDRGSRQPRALSHRGKTEHLER